MEGSFLIKIWLNFQNMSLKKKFFIFLNLAVDVFVFMFLCMFLWEGFTKDFHALFFWVPFLAVITFFRAMQTLRRLKV